MLICRFQVLIVTVCFLLSLPLYAASVRFHLSDTSLAGVSDAVVELVAENPISSSAVNIHEMKQSNRIFSPFVLAVQQGDKVEFPNFDRTRHHVYSFSPAKTFELKLYVGKLEAPIEFEQPGVVAIGCNIHDYMQAFIYVAQSPFYAVSNAQGEVVFNDLLPGKYTVKVWHPWLNKPFDDSAFDLIEEERVIDLKVDVHYQEKPSSPPSGFTLNSTSQ